MVTLAAVLACTVLGVLAGFQLALVLGAPLGHLAWGGRHRVLPTSLRMGSLVSIVIYALIAGVVLARAGLISIDLPEAAVGAVAWAVMAYFFLGIWLNLGSRSKPERVVMSPAAALLCALSAVVALG